MADITQESGVCSILNGGNLHFIGCWSLIIPPLGGGGSLMDIFTFAAYWLSVIKTGMRLLQ